MERPTEITEETYVADEPTISAHEADEVADHPEVFAHKSVGQIADHMAAVVAGLDRKPAVIGHSFGGLLTQILAGRGLSAASVAIDPAPFRGVLPLPFKDHTVPWPIANASYKRYKDSAGVTEIVEMPNRGHSLVIDSGWREVCDTALAFVKRFV